MVLIWLVLPTAVLLAGDALITPMYNFRYTGFSLPAVALAMAVGVARAGDLVRRGPRRILTQAVAVALAIALALPVYAAQRGEFAKDGGSDLRQTAEAVAALAVPGDAVVFDQTVKPSRRPRLALDLYPAAFAAVDDVALITPYVNRGRIWDRVALLDAVHPQLRIRQGVIAVEADRSTSTDLVELERLGFVVVDEVHVHRTTVYRLERGVL
jgi:mannosyltransferase